MNKGLEKSKPPYFHPEPPTKVPIKNTTGRYNVIMKRGDRVYIVANGINIEEFEIIAQQGDFYTLRGIKTSTLMRLRSSRLFKTKEEAQNHLPKKPHIQPQTYFRSPHNL